MSDFKAKMHQIRSMLGLSAQDSLGPELTELTYLYLRDILLRRGKKKGRGKKGRGG